MQLGAVDMPRPKSAATPETTQPSRDGLVSTAVWMKPEERDALKIFAIQNGTTVQEILKACVDRTLASAGQKGKRK